MSEAKTLLTNNLGPDAIEQQMKKKDSKGENKNQNTSTSTSSEDRVKNVYLNDGDKRLVKIPKLQEAIFMWKAHSYYVKDDKEKSILPHACHRMKGEEDVYDKAELYLIKEAAPLWKDNRDEAIKIRQKSNLFEAQTRYKFGFFDVNTGEEFHIDLSEQSGEALYKQIKDYEEEINNHVFVLSRAGKNHNVAPEIKKLSPEQQGHFETAKGKDFDVSRYEKSLYFKNERQQLWDLTKMGFDVTLIGYEVPTKRTNVERSETEVVTENKEKKKEAIQKVEQELNEKEIERIVAQANDTNIFDQSDELNIDIDDLGDIDIEGLPA